MTLGLSQRRSILQEMVGRKMRITAQRRTLIETIQEAEGHLDVATLLKLARRRDARIDRATVYRTLNLLKKLRLVDELDLMHLNGEKHYYEARTTRDHVHLTCVDCGKIGELTIGAFERLKKEIARETGFDIRVTRLELGGRCKACREQQAASGRFEER
jgi:Fur family ferric uptake transcriptional regulator